MDASYQSLLANRLAPALAAAGLKTELWAYDHNTDRPDYPQAVLDNTTRATVNTVAWHCYAPGNPDAVWTPLRNFASRNPGVRQVSVGTTAQFCSLYCVNIYRCARTCQAIKKCMLLTASVLVTPVVCFCECCMLCGIIHAER